jgi:hypothetical protein
MDVDQNEQDSTTSGIYDIPEGYDAEDWVIQEARDNEETAQDDSAHQQEEDQDPNLQDFQ